jgi:large subunit ribosomal protein L29
MKANELRNKTADELQNELLTLNKELFNLRMQRGVGQTPQTHVFKNIKRDIARIKTVLSEREGSSV